MISVVYVCFNEGQKLEDSLNCVEGFADEIVIIDLGSSSNLIKIARRHNAKIYHHQFVPIVEQVRNFSLDKAEGDWILVLDPDEQITVALKEKLKEIMEKDQFAAINIPRKNIFFGKWISHTNWWPDRHIRFFKKGKVNWKNIIHSYPQVSGEVLNLPAEESLAILHFGYQSINEFISRQIRYSGIEAKSLYEDGVRFSWPSFFWKPTREFLVRFLRHRGFLDGFYGLALTILMMIYQMTVLVKIWGLERK